MQKVILTGYMGAGKSVVAAHLAPILKYNWIDLDQEIERVAGISITELFETKGELYFRKLEHELFTRFLASKDPIIISTGGGTPCYYNNHQFLQQTDVASFYLKAALPTLISRLQNERSKRPLLANLTAVDFEEYIAKHLFDRNYYYLQSKFVIAVDEKTVEEIVAEIVEKLT